MRARAALLGTTALVLASAAIVLGTATAQAQSTWIGVGTPGDYNLDSNWNPASAPVTFGSTAVFGDSGTTDVFVSAPVSPTNWTFNADAKNFAITGDSVSFLDLGSGAIINNANSGQTISIANDIGEVILSAQVVQNGNSTLILAGTNNTYSGGTVISAGTVQVTNDNSLGMTASYIAFDGGRLQADGLSNLTFFNDIIVNTTGGTIDNNGIQLALGGNIQNWTGPGELRFTDSSNGPISFPYAGLTILGGDNSAFTGGMRIVETNVRFENANAAGTGAITLDGGTLIAGADMTLTNTIKLVNNSNTNANIIDNNGYALTLASPIVNYTPADPAGVEFADASGGFGTTILTAQSTYTGGTFICSCTTVQFGTTTTPGGVVGDVTNLGVLNIVNSDTTGITSITNDGGATFFANNQSASTIAIENKNGGKTIFATAFGTDAATAGNATIVNRSGGYTAFYAYSTAGDATITNRYTGSTTFHDHSTAGNATIVNRYYGSLYFYDDSSADNATITNRYGAVTAFSNNSTAGNATITNNGSGTTMPGLLFIDATTAGTATIQNNSSGLLLFGLPSGFDTASADRATITNDGLIQFNAFATAASATVTTNNAGGVFFWDSATGDNAQFITNAGGTTDFSQTVGPASDNKITAGSIAGAGDYYLGGNRLTVGGNNLSTTVSGTINDGPSPLLVYLAGCGCGLVYGTGASLEKVGTGTLTLSGINTYTGGTTFTAGTVSVSQEANLGALVGALNFDGGTLQITGTAFNSTTRAINWLPGGGAFDIADAANTFTVAQTLTGNGGLTKLGAGTLVLSGANTYAGGTIIGAGTLSISANNNVGTGPVTMLNGSALQFTSSFTFLHDITVAGDPTFDVTAGNTTVVGGAITDGATPGDVVKTGAGTLILSGNSTYSGGTVITAGVLQPTNGLALGTGTITLNGGTLQAGAGFEIVNPFKINKTGGAIDTNGNLMWLSGAITDGDGPGALTKTGSGILLLTGTNTYTGGTTINAGRLEIGDGGLTGSIVGDVVNNALLSFNRSNTLTFAGAISGTGTVAQNGTGTTVLTGTSTYTGPTNVNSGTLIVNGSIASSSLVTVKSGATLGGNGTVGPTSVSGTLSPGNSIGTIAVSGNLTFVGAGNYLVEVSPTAADRTNVTGTATLAGTITITGENGLYKPKRYTVLNANSVSGTFGTVTVNGTFGNAVRNPHVEYDAANVYFVLDPNAISPFLVNGTVNQKAVAGTIDTLFQSGTGPSQFLKLFDLPASALPNALSQLSGEIGTAAPTIAFKTVDQFLNVMLDPFLETRLGDGSTQGRALSLAPESSVQAALPAELLSYDRIVTKAPRMVAPDQRWTVWGAAYGAAGKFSGDSAIGSSNLTLSTGSFAAGIDYRVAPNTVIGAAVAGSTYNYSLDGAFGSGRGDLVQAGLYASTRFLTNAYLSAALSYGRHNLSTERTVSFGGVFDRLSADFNANSYGGRIESGYRFAALSNFGITPYAAVQAQRFETPSYAERDLTGLGLAGFALNYAGRGTDDTRSELGARFDYRTLTDAGLLTLRARAAWGHEFSTDRSIVAAFQAAPGVPFTVIGAAQAPNVALLSAGAELKLRNGVALRAKFDGEFSGTTNIYGGTAGLYVTW